MNTWIWGAGTGTALATTAWSLLAERKAKSKHQINQPRKKYVTIAEPVLGSFIPYSSQITASIVKTLEGDYLRVWKVDGIDFQAVGERSLLSGHDAFNQLVRSVADGKLAFWSHRVRRRTQVSHPGIPTNSFSESLHEIHVATLEREDMYVNELYLTVVYRPFSAKLGHRLLRSAVRTLGERSQDEEAAIAVLDQLARDVEATLLTYGVTPLGCYEWGSTTISEVLTFLGYLVNGSWQPVPVPNGWIADVLSTSRIYFGHETFEIRAPTGTRYGAILDLKDYPDSSAPGILNPMLYGDYEFIETQSFSPLVKADAQRTLLRQRNQLLAADDAGVSQIEALGRALDQLINGEFVLGEYHYSLAVFGHSLKETTQNLAEARSTLHAQGFQTALVDLIPDAAWFAQSPGNWAYRPRAAYLSSRNFCGLASMHNFSIGKAAGNPWGPAVAVFQTPSRAPFYFNFHASRATEDATGMKLPGNTMIIGQTGSGKTVLELFLLSEATQFDPRIVVFDKNRGTEIGLRAMGADYFVLEQGVPTGINPLHWPVSESMLLFWESWIEQLVDPFHEGISTAQRKEIAHALRVVASFDVEVRSMDVLRQNLSDHSSNSIDARLERWCRGAPLGWVFDSPECRIDIDAKMILGFDTTDFLEDREVRTPIMMCLLHWIERLIDGKPFIYVMAEFWKMLDDPVFTSFVKDKQKTIRKQNGLGIFDTQSPEDVLASPIARTLIEQTATFIFMPNPSADRDDYVEGFKLTEAEYELVRGLPANGREFVVKQGASVALVRFDLSSAPDFVDVLSANTENLSTLDELRDKWGDDPDAWLPDFCGVTAERREGKSRRKSKGRFTEDRSDRPSRRDRDEGDDR